MQPLIKLNGVSVVYNQGEENEMTALHDVNLEIFEGEYIVFFGPSGCGKSTLLYTIAGLESPTSGTVSVGGNDLRSISDSDLITFYRNTIGMVFQAFYLVPHLTAKDNMMLSKMFSGVPKAERERKANELCDRFGITQFADRKPSMMSGGQQQRTAIARALMNDPRIILADEPVGNLDSKNATIVLELLSDIHLEGKKTVIQVTHNPNDVHYADRVFYMKDGMIEQVVTQSHEERKPAPILLPDVSEALIAPPVEIPAPVEVPAPVIEEPVAIEVVEKPEPVPMSEPMLELSHVILQSLVGSYGGRLMPEQVARIHTCIKDRIEGRLTQEHLRMRLDVPFKDGGVGLNSRTALHFAEHINAMLS